MSWLELDDKILDHPKFIRAVKLAGSEAVHLWLGLRAYCGQHLTDGLIPADMLDEVRGPANPERRADALAALVTVGLVQRRIDGIEMHDYLQWSSSRKQVLASREKARERKANYRRGHGGSPYGSPGGGPDGTDDGTDCELPEESRFSPPSPPSPSTPTNRPRAHAVEFVFSVWQEVFGHKNAKLDPKRKRKIEQRLGDFSPDQLCQAIRNAKNDPFLMGQNDTGRVFDGIETLLRDTAQVERLLNLTEPMVPRRADNGTGAAESLPFEVQ